MLCNEKRDSFLPSGSWIVLFWLPAETLSLKRLRGRYEKYQDVIDRLPGEMNDDLTGSISSNKRVKTTASTTADDDDPTSVEATCNAIFNTRTTGTSSDGPNTSIADADGGKPSAG